MASIYVNKVLKLLNLLVVSLSPFVSLALSHLSLSLSLPPPPREALCTPLSGQVGLLPRVILPHRWRPTPLRSPLCPAGCTTPRSRASQAEARHGPLAVPHTLGNICCKWDSRSQRKSEIRENESN